jgi:hypothetical protein
MSKRDIAPADIEALYDFFAKRACEIFNERKQCMPQLALVSLGDDPGDIGALLMVDPCLVNALQESSGTKDALMMLVRVLLANKGAEELDLVPLPRPPAAIVHVSEMWALDGDQQPPADGGSFENVPNRRELIMVTVHTKERSYPGVCPIDGAGDARTATYQPLAQGGEWRGRFFSIHDDGTPGHGTH